MALIVSAGFSAGFRHRIPPNEWGRFVFALSSVLTANEYGLAGFVSYEPVEAALRAGGLTNNANILSDLGTTFPENLYDPHLIESAMARASRLDLPIPALEFQNEAFNVRPAAGEDLGLIALATIAFKLISPSIKGIYFGYLFLLGTSVLLFWCAFNSDRSYTSVLLLMCAVMYVLFVSPLFPGNPKTFGSGAAWTTPLSGHFLSTLALVPALHIMAVNCRGSKASAGQMLCLGGQALILYMAFRMRLSSVWVLGPICCAAIFFFMQRKKAPSSSSLEMTLRHYNSAPRESAWAVSSFLRSLGERFPERAAACWPSLLVLLIAIGIHNIFQSQLHPLYHNGNNLTRHVFWTEVYYGLQSHPQWSTKYASTHLIKGEIATGDDVPMAAVVMYLDNHPEIDRGQVTGPTGNLYWGAIEHYSMLALWDFVRNDPWFVAESIAYKARGVVSVLAAAPLWVVASLSVPEVLLLVILALWAVYALATAGEPERSSFRSYLLLLCLCVPAACVPNLASIVGWELMADAITVWLLVFLVLVVYFASTLVRSSFATRLIVAAVAAKFIATTRDSLKIVGSGLGARR
ncbi:MAG: hypothetical protein ACJ8E5_19125 [Xanthobacteraceae bacterium]